MPDSDFPASEFIGLVRFEDMDAAQAAAWLAVRPADAPFGFIVTPNAQHLVLIARGDAYAQAAAAAALVLNDSQVVRALARLCFGQRLKLAAGSDLTAILLREVIRPLDPITVIGGSPATVERLRAQYGLTRIAQHIPPMGYAEQPQAFAAARDFVRDHPARFTFVCTGAPRSEALLLAVQRAGGGRGIGLPVGAALDFATGLVRRAPAPVRRAGLEWLWRLARNPLGHFRRVFIDSAPLLVLVWRAWRGRRAHG